MQQSDISYQDTSDTSSTGRYVLTLGADWVVSTVRRSGSCSCRSVTYLRVGELPRAMEHISMELVAPGCMWGTLRVVSCEAVSPADGAWRLTRNPDTMGDVEQCRREGFWLNQEHITGRIDAWLGDDVQLFSPVGKTWHSLRDIELPAGMQIFDDCRHVRTLSSFFSAGLKRWSRAHADSRVVEWLESPRMVRLVLEPYACESALPGGIPSLDIALSPHYILPQRETPAYFYTVRGRAISDDETELLREPPMCVSRLQSYRSPAWLEKQQDAREAKEKARRAAALSDFV